MIRRKLIIAIAAALLIYPVASFSQEAKKKAGSEKSELVAIHQLIEDQSKQITDLTGQVAHLTQLVEALQHAAAVAAAAPAPTAPPAVPVATPDNVPAVAGVVAPAAETPGTHTVTKGETLTSIARHYKTTVADLLKLNKIENDRMLQIGQTLVIPTPTPVDNTPPKKENQ